MDNYELLELAARAIDRNIFWISKNAYLSKEDGTYGVYWNPFENDIDAFQLAVKLQINIVFVGSFVRCSGSGERFIIVDEKFDNGVDQAVRRAIVRCAAKIGESLT